MASSGSARSVGRPKGSGSAETRRALVAAAIDTLRENGFGGASARASPSGRGVTRGSSSTTSVRWPTCCSPRWMRSAPHRLAQYQEAVAGPSGSGRLVDAAPSHLRGGPRRRLHHRPGRDDRRRLVDPRPGCRGRGPDRAVADVRRRRRRAGRWPAPRWPRWHRPRRSPTGSSRSTSDWRCSPISTAIFAGVGTVRPGRTGRRPPRAARRARRPKLVDRFRAVHRAAAIHHVHHAAAVHHAAGGTMTF